MLKKRSVSLFFYREAPARPSRPSSDPPVPLSVSFGLLIPLCHHYVITAYICIYCTFKNSASIFRSAPCPAPKRGLAPDPENLLSGMAGHACLQELACVVLSWASGFVSLTPNGEWCASPCILQAVSGCLGVTQKLRGPPPR